MALSGWSASNFLHRASDVGTEPFLISAWGNVASAPSFNMLVGKSTGAAFTGYRAMAHRGGAGVPIKATVELTAEAVATTATPTGAWHHAAVAFVSTTLREAWVNGANKGTNTTSITPGAADRVRIGLTPSGVDAYPGGLAEVSFWDLTGFSSTDRDNLVAALASGDNPLNLTAAAGQPWTGKLLAYWIDSANTITDLSANGRHMTLNGTLTNFGSHPTIDAVATGGLLGKLAGQGGLVGQRKGLVA